MKQLGQFNPIHDKYKTALHPVGGLILL